MGLGTKLHWNNKFYYSLDVNWTKYKFWIGKIILWLSDYSLVVYVIVNVTCLGLLHCDTTMVVGSNLSECVSRKTNWNTYVKIIYIIKISYIN